MASPFDELDREHLVQIHKLVDTMVKMFAIQQEQIRKLSQARSSDPNYRSRKYLRDLLKQTREELAQQRSYIVQLENELRLRGLE